ncbi:subunit IV of cytochrome c oxidase [Cordyceps militaris CM01]|uniref:Cytochrome c oxidase subunit 4, mitochondrial n=1 Tax=Cordyceps militaris (strain CM01) TaxID=983644 RepID=G3J838_CORMM|nr:subunit IV of cytochrome c oxidase [Cordyceps militaris CM01]EGX93880.1 subunit IV of cytochrome c oxidase [Cordyceps militaris CM01]
MYKYPPPRYQAASLAAEAPGASDALAIDPAKGTEDKERNGTDIIRGFIFEEPPVKQSTLGELLPGKLKSTPRPPPSSLQELERLAASCSPYENVQACMKEQMIKALATRSDSIFVHSQDGKTYQEPFAVRGVPIERIEESSPYWQPSWSSLEELLLKEEVAQQKKAEYRAQAEALGVPKTDKKHKLRKEEKTASDDCSKYAKIREIFGNGNGKYHPNQLVAKKYMPPKGLCEKELLYKLALKISNLQELFQKKKLSMDPYDFYRWTICKNLKTDLHNALNNSHNGLTGLIRTMGDDGKHADPVFRTIVLYWASLTGNENKFGKNKKASTPRARSETRTRLGPCSAREPRSKLYEKQHPPSAYRGLGGRDLASLSSHNKMMQRRKRRNLAKEEAARPKVFEGVNAHRAEMGVALTNADQQKAANVSPGRFEVLRDISSRECNTQDVIGQFKQKLELSATFPPEAAHLTNPSTTGHHFFSIRLTTSNPTDCTELSPLPAMFMQRTVIAAARRAAIKPTVARTFTTSFVRREAAKGPSTPADQAAALSGESSKSIGSYKTFTQVKTEDDLFGPGAKAGTVPTDLEQSTGLERLEILGKMEGVDIFDMRPLDASRLGTMEDPIKVRSAGDEQYLGCTGYPADSHVVTWLGISKERPIERCPECGSVYKMDYVGPEDDHHGHHHGPEYPEPQTFADYIKPEYRYR